MDSSNAVSSSINPYELFGVDPQKITLRELKKKYYELALLVHPDKNNVRDGGDMIIVHRAYKYCERELLHTASKETSVDALTADFDAFCRTQQEAPPPFRDIMEDALEMAKFNDEFERTEGFKASFAGGYGTYMEDSEYATTAATLSYDNVADSKPLKNDFSSLAVYREQVVAAPDGDYYDYAATEPIESYTVYMKRTCLTDYKEANAPQEILVAVAGPVKSLEAVLGERKEQDDAFRVKWLDEELANRARKIVR